MSTTPNLDLREGYTEKFGFHDTEQSVFKSRRGLDREIVAQISEMKGEPAWMRDYRLKALELFEKKPMPTWGPDLSTIDFQNIFYYVKPTSEEARSWDDVPADMKRTFDKLGIPEAEQKFLSGVGAQYDSEVVYHKIQEKLEQLGVLFLSCDHGLKEHEALFKEYFGTVIPSADNKFAALNSAVWSGGSFIYVPKGVHVDVPLQAYFRINTKDMGQFERTLIIVDEGAFVHYVEGCLPPGEQVSLGDRWVNIESVRPGDTVMDSDGNEAQVASARVRPFKGELVRLVPVSSANAFQVTPEHPVLGVRRRGLTTRRTARGTWLREIDNDALCRTRPEFIPASQLERGDFMVFPVSKITRPNERFTREVMRLLGYYLAEGSAYVHKKLHVPVVAFSFNEKERETIDEVKALILGITGKRAMEIHSPARHGTEVRVYSQDLLDLCVEHCSRHAAEKRLSKTVMELPAPLQNELLETYLKGDGSVYRKRKHTMVRAATASQALAWQLQELFARQGHYATITVRKGGKDTILGRTITRRDQYILYFSPDREKSQVRQGDGCFLVPIKRVERTPYEGPVFNFELESQPNAYVARGFAVHNCTAPTYSSDSLHSAVVEIIVKRGARCRYTTIQNWSNNVYNLVTKRAVAYRNATMEWVDGNLGSKITQKYPSVYMMEPGAHGEILSIAFAGHGQHQDAGGKVIHCAPNTTSKIISKSISKDGGRAGYRGLVKVQKGAVDSRSTVNCDALILDEKSRSDTYPYMEIEEDRVSIGHEATVSKIGDEQLFYLQSRGIPKEEAAAMIVSGFIEPIVKELPMEYAVEMNRLIQLQMEGSVG
ncbi:MAG: Fe-S cluster assembly protein SufB [Candidatus Eisenbacteria bacterium]|uniref:Fe-S cluster assembly protein SufB n=1 Tax=Eiseniibacteriota bacterium TaxID=2212470 RepID=A0A538U8S7_UNCEI|nr:MAG: Fe-S cluster assembly protein SufB [Candidatus Eisenbacteria bacterium]